jgi:hypothetical protein
MKHFRVMIGQSRFQLVLALAGIAIATTAVMASGASFTSQTANAANVFSTGTLSMTNTPSGMSSTVATMVPGDFHTGTVVIKNTGDVAGHFYLDPVTITANTKGLAAQLRLIVLEGSTEIYNGTLAGLPQKDLGTFAANASRTYTFTVTFPDSGPGADNAFMGATATAAFNWTAASVATGSR